MYKPGGYVGMDGKTREQYIDGNVKNSLNDEGEATISNLQVRDELLKAKAGDIGVAGAGQEVHGAVQEVPAGRGPG